MNTFTVLTPVDTSTGIAVIGKAHVIEKREEVIAESYIERIGKANKQRKKQPLGSSC